MHDENSSKGIAKAVVPALTAAEAGALPVFVGMKWQQGPVDQSPEDRRDSGDASAHRSGNLGGSDRLISKSLVCPASCHLPACNNALDSRSPAPQRLLLLGRGKLR